MKSEPAEFTYTYSVPGLIGAVALCGAFSTFFAYLALDNDRGLVIKRAIHLGIEGATSFYWSIGGLFMLGFLFFLAILVTRKYFPKRIVLESHYMLVPTSRWPFSTYEQVVKYKDIIGFQTFVASRMTTLRVLHSGGKTEIDAVRFGSKAHFQIFCKELGIRASGARGDA